MVERLVLPAWARGRPVVANLALRPELLGFPRELYVPLRSWRQIPELSGCTLCLDEISSVLPSRQAMSVPPQLVRILNQLRKGDVELGWTAPNWARCDVLLREVTQAVTVCRGSFPDRWEREQVGAVRFQRPRRRDAQGEPIRQTHGWGPNRLFRWTTYDAMEFDEFTYSTSKQLQPRGSCRYWRPRHFGDVAYETLEAVDLLDHLDDVGVCVVCGGTRTRAKCSCATDRADGGRKGRQARVPPSPVAGPEILDGRDPLGPVGAPLGDREPVEA